MRARRTLWKTETELAAAVVLWLRDGDWEVYQEVQLGGPVCDLVAVRGPLVWAIETKLNFGTAVVEQATAWLPHAHFVSVATPSARASSVLSEYCRWKGIGWLHVTKPSGGYPPNADCTHERIPPELHRRVTGDLRAALREEHKTACPAGSNRGGYLTPFKETCRRVAELVKQRPGITLRFLVEELTTHYASKASARAGIVHWTERGKVPGVRVDRTGKHLRLFPV